MRSYLAERFRRNNIPKYHRYCDEWIDNTTLPQLLYIHEEKRRIENGIKLM